MPTVTYKGASYPCTTAIKGDTYIRLLDAEDAVLASFEGVTDFSVFTISDGSWTSPEDLDQCCLVVMRRDGTLVKTTKKVCDVGNVTNLQSNKSAVTPTTSQQTIYPDSGYDAMTKVVVNPIPSSYVKPSATQAAKTWTPGTTDQSIPAGTYCSGKQTIKGDANHVEENIKSGVTLFGILGSYRGEWTFKEGTAYLESDGQSLTVSGITRADPAILLLFAEFEFDPDTIYDNRYVVQMTYIRDLYALNNSNHWAVYAVSPVMEETSGVVAEDYRDSVYQLSTSDDSKLVIDIDTTGALSFKRRVGYTVFAFYDS